MLKIVQVKVWAELGKLVIATAILAGFSGPAHALIVGVADPQDGNCFPFGCINWAPQYQQIYAANKFPGARLRSPA